MTIGLYREAGLETDRILHCTEGRRLLRIVSTSGNSGILGFGLEIGALHHQVLDILTDVRSYSIYFPTISLSKVYKLC